MKRSWFFIACLAMLLSACAQRTEILQEGTFGMKLSSPNVQEVFDRLVTGESREIMIHSGQGGSVDSTSSATALLSILKVTKIAPGQFCKSYQLVRWREASVVERGTVCKSDEFTNGKWVDSDTWNALPRETR